MTETCCVSSPCTGERPHELEHWTIVSQHLKVIGSTVLLPLPTQIGVDVTYDPPRSTGIPAMSLVINMRGDEADVLSEVSGRLVHQTGAATAHGRRFELLTVKN